MRHFDLVIVGAGAIGCTLATLSMEVQDPARTLLVDRGFVAGGTTYHSPGHSRPHGDNVRQCDLADRSLAYFERIAPKLPMGAFQRKDFVGVVDRSSAAGILSAFVRGTPVVVEAPGGGPDGLGLPVRITARQVLIKGGYTFVAQPRKVVGWLKSVFLGAGGNLWEGAHVEGLSRETNGDWFVTFADGRAVIAGRVALAVGPWALCTPFAKLLPDLPLRRKKICALHLLAPVANTNPLIYLHDDDAYLMPRPDWGYWVMSFTSPHWDCAIDLSKLFIDARDRAVAAAILARYAPDTMDRIGGGRVSSDLYAPDFNPAAWLAAEGRLVFAGAGSGNGFRLSPAVASDALRLLYPEQTHRARECLP